MISNTEGCLAVTWLVCAQFMCLPSPYRSQHENLTMSEYNVRTRQADQLTLSYLVSSYLLSLWFPHIWENTILYYHLAIQHACLLFLSVHWLSSPYSWILTLGWWIPNIQDFVISDRLLPYCLWNPYGHFSAFLSLLLVRSWHLFGTYSHLSFNILLRGSIYYKNLHTTLE